MTQPASQRPRRVLLKLSGEVFGGGRIGVDPDVVKGIASQISKLDRIMFASRGSHDPEIVRNEFIVVQGIERRQKHTPRQIAC